MLVNVSPNACSFNREPTLGAFPKGKNAISDFIPVARIADMLNFPGNKYDFNGERRVYPDIKLIFFDVSWLKIPAIDRKKYKIISIATVAIPTITYL